MAVVAVVLLTVPHAPVPVLPQVTDQVTPAFAESLVTVAVSDAAALVKSDAGAPARATDIGGGVVEVVVPLPPPPHAARAAVRARAAGTKIDSGNFNCAPLP